MDRTIDRRTLLAATGTLGLGVLGLNSVAAGCARTSGAPAAPEAGSTPALREDFEASARQLQTPGAVMLLRTPSGEFSAAYGSRTDTGSEPVTLADHVRIGSITKTFTGTVILQLAQEGHLDIDAPVSEYRTDVPNGRNITLSQLLSMRSGLYNYSESLEFNQTLDSDPTKVWTTDELLDLGFKYPPYFPPGTEFHYSNTNTVLLGLIAEQVDRRPLGVAFQTRFFTPRAMRETAFPDVSSSAIATPHPRGYMYGTNVSTMNSEALPLDQQAAARAGTLKPHDVTDWSPSWTWAAGGAISTAADLATWATALGDGTLLNPTWQRRRLDSIRPTNPSSPSGAGYGLGIAMFGPMYGHTGELPGFQSFAAVDPDRKRTLVVWANLNAAPDGRPPASTIAQKLIGKLYA